MPGVTDLDVYKRQVVQREGQVALRGIHDIHLLQVDRRPVADAVTHQIDESVGQGDEPENLVLENVVDEEFFEGDFLFFSQMCIRDRCWTSRRTTWTCARRTSSRTPL